MRYLFEIKDLFKRAGITVAAAGAIAIGGMALNKRIEHINGLKDSLKPYCENIDRIHGHRDSTYFCSGSIPLLGDFTPTVHKLIDFLYSEGYHMKEGLDDTGADIKLLLPNLLTGGAFGFFTTYHVNSPNSVNFGPKLSKLLKKFQSDNGLRPTGEMNYQTSLFMNKIIKKKKEELKNKSSFNVGGVCSGCNRKYTRG